MYICMYCEFSYYKLMQFIRVCLGISIICICIIISIILYIYIYVYMCMLVPTSLDLFFSAFLHPSCWLISYIILVARLGFLDLRIN